MSATVCWFVQSHRDPELILRLVRTLRRGARGPIVVRHDPFGCELDPAPFLDLPDVHFLPGTYRQIRADFSCQMQPYLDLIDWLDREKIHYDWLINTTAQDYPVKPVPEIERDLEVATCDGFVRRWDVLSGEGPWSRRKARARYWHRYWLLPSSAEPWLRRFRWLTRILPLHFYLDYGAYVGIRRLRVPFDDRLRCHGGWAWWTLRHDVVRYLREFLATRPEVERHYRRTVAPEESMVQTILATASRFDLVNDDLRYVDYSRAVRGAPRTLTIADFPRFTTGRYHLARKFDLAADRELIDRVDREIHGCRDV